ncbi:SusC/RagA family TonB-linked outer membrane protein [Bacteroidia bacterium]|nr:SusC/RagA family TonB-linked outer membrane protein [Bacteroidia bacterium]
MKITTAFILAAVFSLEALNTHSQTIAKVSISSNSMSLGEFISTVEAQNHYLFLYSEKEMDMKQQVNNVKVSNKPITQVLSQVFAGTEITYSLSENYISLRKKSGDVSSISQQSRRITGTVIDSNGEPVIGANVVEKNVATNGTITDVNGNFSLNVSPGVTLTISYIGYTTKEVATGNQTSLRIVLDENALVLDEVVVIGYGSVRRADLTGSVASVSGEQLKNVPVGSASQAITGRLPGVQVTKTEGSPDAEIKIRVRGGGSITQDNSPLFIVDGFPVDNIDDIAPANIQNIDVLKDASSTAIYGARGANGVIIITTKSGSEGKAKINYNMYCGIKDMTKQLAVLDPYEYVLWQFEATPSASSVYGDFQDIGLYKDVKGINWQDEVFGRTGTSIYNNLSVSGGSKVSKYNLSLIRDDEEEIMLGSGFSRTTLSVKTSYDVKPWLTLELNGRLGNTDLKGAGTGLTSSNAETSGRLIHAIQYRPVMGISEFVDPDLVDASYYEGITLYSINPLEQTKGDYRRRNQFVTNVTGAASFKISKDLKYRFEFGTQYTKQQNKRFYGLRTSDVWNYQHPMAEITYNNAKSYRVANIVTYNRRNILPGSSITAMFGEELNISQSDRIVSSAKMFPKYIDPESALSMMSLGIPDPIDNFVNPPTKTSSFFGRLNYDYKNRYLVTAVLRADGSSKFAPGNRWGYFPSAAVAWRILEEDFMKFSKTWLSNLKARISYGESGNNRIGDDVWKKTFQVISSTSKMYAEGNEENASSILQLTGFLSNPSLKWETTVTRNAGLDFGFFKQRLTGTVEYYKNVTKDLLIRASIPVNSGYSSQWQNIGQTSNRGIEVTLEGVIVENKNFSLSASFNIGFNKNRIDNLGETTEWLESSGLNLAYGPSGDYLVRAGQPVGIMYGYKTDGMYTFDDFDYNEVTKTYVLREGVPDNRAVIGAKYFMPGALKFANQDDNPIINADDKVIIGDANPKHTGGFGINSQYKGFDLSVFFNWVYGNDVYNANKLYFSGFNSSRAHKNLLAFMNSDNAFTYLDKSTGIAVTDPERLKEMNKNATIWAASMTNTPLHSWGVEDGSFLRLNNLTLGYSFPKNILSRLRMEQLRVYVTGYNLWLWTNYSGFDPEVDTRRTTPVTPSVDWCAYPRSRSYNIGVNITF